MLPAMRNGGTGWFQAWVAGVKGPAEIAARAQAAEISQTRRCFVAVRTLRFGAWMSRLGEGETGGANAMGRDDRTSGATRRVARSRSASSLRFRGYLRL